MRIELRQLPGAFAQVAAAIGQQGAILGAIDLVRVESKGVTRDVTVACADGDHAERVVAAVRAARRREGRQRLRPHVPDAQGRQDRGHAEGRDPDPRRPQHGLHAGRRPRLLGDPRRPRVRLGADHQGQHGRGRVRRHRGARAGRHRPGRGDARHGGQGDAVQGARRRRRLAAVPRHDRHRRDRPDRRVRRARRSAGSTSRTSPRRAASRSSAGCRTSLDIPVFHDDQHGTAIVVLAALLNALQGRPQDGGERARGRRRRRRGRHGLREDHPQPRRHRPRGVRHRRHPAPEPHRPRPRARGDGRAAPTRAGSPAVPTTRSRAPTWWSACPPRARSPSRPSARWPTTRSCSRWPTRSPRSSPRRSWATCAIMATGRSDYPNQINNVLAFPGIFRGALDVRAPDDRRGR